MSSVHRALLCAACIAALSPVFSSSFAADPQEKYKEVQKKIKEHREKLVATEKQERSLLTEMQDINEKLGRTESTLLNYRRELRKTEAQISGVLSEISRLERAIEKQKTWMRLRLKTMYKYRHSGSVMLMVLNSVDLSQMMRMMRYAEAVSVREDRLIGDFRQNLSKLETQNGRLQSLRAEILTISKNVRTAQDELEEQKKAKDLLLSSVRMKKTEYNKMIAELEESSKKLLELIRESEKTGEYDVTTEFRKMKGKLIWPASGEIAVPYGSHKDPRFDTPVFRNGIHISTETGSSVKTVYSGKVIFAEWFQGFGKLVIINHGSGYHTLYGNLSEIFSRVGDIINENQSIGKVGTSGVLNSPGLYFEIRYKGKPLNPVQWLKRAGG